jgi:glycosyltransferase involved in cell wall biosynthesis
MIGIKYVSLYEESGYGISARLYMRGLVREGVPLVWAPMVQGSGLKLGYEPFDGQRVGSAEFDEYCNRGSDYDLVIVHTVPEYFPYWRRNEQGKTLFGYTVWETDRIPRHWPELLDAVDHLLVPSEFTKAVFVKSGVRRPISVIPHISEFTAASGEELEEGTVNDGLAELPTLSSGNEFVFYSIGTWTNRKAIWKILTAYLETFTRSDPVLLIVKTSGKDYSRKPLFKFRFSARTAADKIIAQYQSPAPILLITRKLSAKAIRWLHERGDCYVSLCHSEGWGMGAFEAACMGKPVIMTGYGGQREFLPADLSYLVRYDTIPVADKVSPKSYSADQTWAEPDAEHASLLMKEVFCNQGAARWKGVGLQRFVTERFNENATIEKLMRALQVSA